MGGPARQIAMHFTHVSALLVATWALKKILNLKRLKGSSTQTNMRKSRSHRLFPTPETQFEPAVAGWMQDWIAVMNDPNSAADADQPFHIYERIDKEIAQGQLEFGTQKMSEQLFMLDKRKCRYFLNAGSYGAVFRLAAEARTWFQDLLEQQPVLFNELEAIKAMQVAKKAVAGWIGASMDDFIPVVNASSAICIVLDSVNLDPGDLVLVTSITYSAVKNAAARYTARAGAGIVSVILDFETLINGQEAVLQRFKSVIDQYGSRIKLAIIDDITSNPTFHMPVTDLIAMLKAHDSLVCVDGAHAIGTKPLSMNMLGADFYTSNLHKWACCPKSAAFLWVKPSLQESIVPPCTSHGFKQGWQAEFSWPGTIDTSAWLSVPTALKIWNALGIESVRCYRHEQLQQAVLSLKSAWGPDLVVLGADDTYSCMASIELPELGSYEKTSQGSKELHEILRKDFGTEVVVQCWESRLWVRISSQIFNCTEDYTALHNAVNTLRNG